MKDDIEAQQLNAFVDGELDLTRQLEVEKAMKEDAGLRTRVEGLKDLRRLLRDEGDYHVAPDALRQRIETMARARPAGPTAVAAAKETMRRWWGWRPLSAAVAATLALSLGMQLFLARENHETRLADEVVAGHVRSTLGQHLIDVASSDHHTVKPWLSSKLDFSPPVRDAQIGSAVFLGGRVDYLDGRPVAALVYRQGAHIVNAFVWPGPSNDSPVVFSTERGFQIAHWSRDGMNHWVISDVNRGEFMTLVHLLASPIDERPSTSQ
jgi:anti-sigma factor RsiW